MENTSTIALNEQQGQQKISFQFQKNSIHLTYETHLSKDELIDFINFLNSKFEPGTFRILDSSQEISAELSTTGAAGKK